MKEGNKDLFLFPSQFFLFSHVKNTPPSVTYASERWRVDKTDTGWQRGCHACAVHLFVGSKHLSVKWKKLVREGTVA